MLEDYESYSDYPKDLEQQSMEGTRYCYDTGTCATETVCTDALILPVCHTVAVQKHRRMREYVSAHVRTVLCVHFRTKH